MCGVVASRTNRSALPTLLYGLSRLEYRGYDSAGVALTGANRAFVVVVKAAGRLSALSDALAMDPHVTATTVDDLSVGIGHTRWATHGEPTVQNAHPHLDCSGNIALVHNGVIDNYAELRDELLLKGHRFASGVDSELIAHLIEDRMADEGSDDTPQLVRAVGSAVRQLRGSWALAVVAAGSDEIVLARHRSPLLVAQTDDGVVAASDHAALPSSASRVQVLGDGQLAHLASEVTFYDQSAHPVAGPKPAPAIFVTEVDLGSAPDYTSKEIAEQPALVADLVERLAEGVLAGRLHGVDLSRASAPIRLLGCGSSRYAAQVVSGVLQQIAGVASNVVIASEHAYAAEVPGAVTLAFSQSGETADILTAAEDRRGPWVALTNVGHSSLGRLADSVIELGAGQEFAVAATKTFTAQIVAGTCVALSMARALGLLSRQDVAGHLAVLAQLPERLAATDALCATAANGLADALADRLRSHPGVLFLSRGLGVPYASEGALKLKELSYAWAEAMPAGELKHGPIALIEPGTPVVVIDADPRERLAAGVAEVRSRGAHVLWVGGPAAALPTVAPATPAPWGPIESVIALQHLARAVTVAQGLDVDRPRNLAKSVTVE